MYSTRSGLLAAAACCGLAATGAPAGDDKPPGGDDAAIKAFVDHLGKNGVGLKADGRNWWVVTDPKGDGYEVIVSLRAFPAGATEKEMEDTLRTINLAYTLNVPSRLAMSHPGLRVSDPSKPVPKLDKIPVAAKLEKLFKDYRPAEPKK
ncbi:MAG: hypothetical protein C0501_19850 [Isosphaera sp.]|nr:hypothetical protein [Isosphaera sp.]